MKYTSILLVLLLVGCNNEPPKLNAATLRLNALIKVDCAGLNA